MLPHLNSFFLSTKPPPKITGKCLTVALLDSGAAPCRELDGKILIFHDLVNGRKDLYDDYGHGTHVAGVIAGKGLPDFPCRGPVPKVNLVIIKVLDEKGVGKEATIIKGIHWCIERREDFGIRILNLSLGGTAHSSWLEDPLCLAAQAAWRAGIVVCTPAGNEGSHGEGSIRSPGIQPLVITVGAVNTAHRVCAFSGRGPTLDGLVKPDLVAPGDGIVGLRAPGSTLDQNHPGCRVGKNHFLQTGTSVATAIVSRVAASLLDHNPILSPDLVKNILLHTTMDLGEAKEKQGHGLLQPGAVLAAAERFYHLGARPIYLRTHAPLTGCDISLIQERLRREGATSGPLLAGVYDSTTYAAARSFQEHYGLPPTGILEGESYPLLGGPTPASWGKNPFGQRILSLGMYGYDVWVLQNKLNLLGYNLTEPATGYFDPSTRNALALLQREKGILPANGLLGHETYCFIEEKMILGGRILTPGDRGADVREMQLKLRHLALYGGIADGYYGPQTQKAVTLLHDDGVGDTGGICTRGTFWHLGQRKGSSAEGE